MSSNSKYKTMLNNIGYNIIGQYVRGASKDVASTGSNINGRQLGIEIMSTKSGLKEPGSLVPNAEDYNSPVDRLSVLHSLIARAEECFEERYSEILDVSERLTEDELNKFVLDSAKTVSRTFGKYAFAEGLMDDELKENIRTILQDGKEKFLARSKEAEDTKAAELEDAETMPEMNPEEQQANNGMDGEPMDLGGDDDMEQGFDDGFGTPFNEDTEAQAAPSADINKAASDMSQFNDGLEDANQGQQQPQAANESYLSIVDDILNNHKYMGIAESQNRINKLISKKLVTAAEVKNRIDDYNDKQDYKESLIYMNKGRLTTMSEAFINKTVNKMLAYEEKMFKDMTKKFTVKELAASEDFKTATTLGIQYVAIKECAKHVLNLD